MRMPKAWQAGLDKAKLLAKSKKLTAKIDMSEEVVGAGLCPECKQPMKEVIVNGMPALCCMEHRIVLPKKND